MKRQNQGVGELELGQGFLSLSHGLITPRGSPVNVLLLDYYAPTVLPVYSLGVPHLFGELIPQVDDISFDYYYCKNKRLKKRECKG